MAPYAILVVEDDADINGLLCRILEREGYRPTAAYAGSEAMLLLQQNRYDLVLLDLMLPGVPGEQLVQAVRDRQPTPIIVISARTALSDKVELLRLGADDYITKPFNPVEMLARVRSQLRRYLQLGGGQVRPSTLVIGGICLDDNAKAVTVDGDPVALTPKEYDILRFLMQNAGTVFSPSEIYRRVWDDVPLNATGAIAVHIRHLREKLEINPSEPRYIKVVWGKGYKMEGTLT